MAGPERAAKALAAISGAPATKGTVVMATKVPVRATTVDVPNDVAVNVTRTSPWALVTAVAGDTTSPSLSVLNVTVWLARGRPWPSVTTRLNPSGAPMSAAQTSCLEE